MTGLDVELARSLYGGAQEPKPAAAPNLPAPDTAYTSPEAAAAVRASQGIDVMGRAPTPEHALATQQGEQQMAQGQQEAQQRAVQDYLQDVAVRSAAKAYEAKGFLPNVGYHLGAAAKGIGDAAAWTLGAAFKAGSSLASGVTGGGFGHGWEVGGQNLQQITGTTDPSILDLIPGISGVREGMTLGQRTDTEIQRKLGNAAVFSQTAGHLIGMVIDPFAVGKGASEATRIVSGGIERTIGRMVMREAPGATEAVAQGKVWQLLAQQPGWKTAAGLIDRTAPMLSETVQAGAANIAQSFAMSPDAHRADAVKMAAYMTPLLLPIMRIGEKLGGAAMRMGMSPEETARIAAAYKQLETGQIGAGELDKIIAANSRLPARLVGQAIVAPAFEGTAFMAMDPSAREELQKALSGKDPEAWGRLVTQWLGTWAGVAAGKYMLPSHLTPFFKAVRPDANSLNTFLAAEANRRASVEKPMAPQEPVPQETAPYALQQHEAARKQTLDKLREGIQQRSEQDRVRESADKHEAELIQNYGWAQGPSLGLLRASWTPDLVQGSQDVGLTFGRDHRVVLGRDADGGTVLRLDPKLEGILADNGMPTVAGQDRTVLSPTMVEYRGEAAHKTLDDLALIGLSQRLRGDLVFQRVGFHEESPGVWADETGRLYTRQLDGTTVSKLPDSKTWTELHHMEAEGFPEGPQWTNDTTEQLKAWLIRKMVTAPDAAVDSVMHQAIALAHNGESFGADQIRMFLSGVPIEALAKNLQSPEGYRFLAMELGSLASSHNNAQFATIELGRDAMRRGNAPVGSRKLPPGLSQPYAGPKPAEGPITEQAVADVARQAAESPQVGQAVNALAPQPEPRPSSYREDAAREHLREQAKKFENDVQVQVGSNQAALLKDWFPKNSAVAKQLDGLEAGGSLNIPVKEAKKFVDYYARRADRQVRPETQAMDDFVQKLVEAHGLPTEPVRGTPVEGAPTGRPPAPIGEPVSGEASRAPEPRQGPETLGERILQAGDQAESGSINPLGPKQRQAVGRAARSTHEFLLETQPEVLRKAVPGEKLPYEIRRAVSEGERMGDEFMALFRPGDQLAKGRPRDVFSPKERAERRAIRRAMVASEINPERASYSRWELLANGEIPPQNDRERAFVKAYQDAGKAAYEAQRQAGAVRAYPQPQGEPKFENLRKQEKSIVPYRFTPEFFEALNHPDSRAKLFDLLASENPNGKMPQYVKGKEPGVWDYRGEGPVTRDSLEALFQKESQSGKSDSALRESAAEHFRMLQHVPHVADGVKIRETDYAQAITGALRQQGRRAASLQQFGPDVPAAARRAMLDEAARTGLSNPTIEAFRQGRTGVEDRLARFQEALNQSRALAGRNPKTVAGMARDLMVRAQGGQPEQLWNVTQAKSVQDFLGITGSAMAAGGFRWDIAEPLTRTGAYAGYWRSFKTLVSLLRPRNFHEAAALVDRWGAVERAVTEHITDEIASKPAKAIAEFLQLPGSWTERFKQVFNAIVANKQLEAFRTGRATESEYQSLQDELRLSPEDMQAVREGKIGDQLGSQIRRELTQLYTSRVQRAEGSRFAASRNAGTIFRFHRFATMRLEQSIRNAASVVDAMQRDGVFSKGALSAMGRFARVQLGVAVGGLAGQAIAYAMTSMARGENPLEGVLRVWRELSYAPFQTTLKAFSTQLLGGPYGQLVNALVNNKDVKSAMGLTIPGQLAYAAGEFATNTAESLGKGDWKQATDGLIDALGNAAANAGAVPFQGDARAMLRAIQAAHAGQDPQTLADAQVVRDWKRFEKIQTPSIDERTKPDAFYDSIGKVLEIAHSMPNSPPKEIVHAAMEDLRKALALAPEQSVASAIEGHMLTRGLTDEQRQQLHKYLGDDQRITRVYQHDDALKNLAKEVRRLEGTYPTPFQNQLDAVKQQARFGGTDRWKPIAERVVDEATQKLLAGDGESHDIEDLAEAMSVYGPQVAPLFDKGMQRYLAADHVDSTAKARRIAAVLHKRALERRAETIKTQNRERNQPK